MNAADRALGNMPTTGNGDQGDICNDIKDAWNINNDTIAAIATSIPPSDGSGDGAISIIRISGPDAFKIVSQIFHGKRPFYAIKPYTIGYGSIFELLPESGGVERRVDVDEVLILKMIAPRSYTREDVVEIHCHAGAEVQRRILRLLMAGGARAATPGEFTKRAFINGRIDLSQAEAVMDLIRAQSDMGASAAMRQLEGVLSNKLRAVREQLIGLVASLEAFLDFPEHEVEEQSIGEIDATLRGIETGLQALADSFAFGRVARDGINAVIAGRPNVGKSTLLNLFAGSERAIVTEIPGTTRDVIDTVKNLGGFVIRFLDTAGIRETDDVVEGLGVARSIDVIGKADIVLLMFGADEGFQEGDARLIKLLEGKKRIYIINKTDLAKPGAVEAIRSEIAADSKNVDMIVNASLISGEGLSCIEDAIRKSFTGQKPVEYGEAVLTNERHYALVQRGIEAIRAAHAALTAGIPFEMTIIDMREALAALGEITGETYNEDIINRIFSEFCIGK